MQEAQRPPGMVFSTREVTESVTISRPCGSHDFRLTDRLDPARCHRSLHFGSAAYSLSTAQWFRLNVSEEKLDLFELTASLMAQSGTCPAQVMWG
jgi:hypothetical protein